MMIVVWTINAFARGATCCKKTLSLERDCNIEAMPDNDDLGPNTLWPIKYFEWFRIFAHQNAGNSKSFFRRHVALTQAFEQGNCYHNKHRNRPLSKNIKGHIWEGLWLAIVNASCVMRFLKFKKTQDTDFPYSWRGNARYILVTRITETTTVQCAPRF